MSLLYIGGITNTCDEINIIKDVFLKATNNVEWLKKGDTVLLKPALNSKDPYPATTHPHTVHAIAQILKEKGAEVIIGDQSGIEHVLHSRKGILKGSSTDCYTKSGMKKNEITTFIGFEKEGWKKGFFHFQDKRMQYWRKGFFITNWIQKVDHIINLPRLSTHVQAGVTLGFKNLVGLLREDSRLEFHMNGPFSAFMKMRAKKAEIAVEDDKTNSFFQKIVEISLAVQHKLRLTLLTATKAQVTLGPDAYMLGNLLPSHVVDVAPGIVLASSDQVALESGAIALLILLYRRLPKQKKIIQYLVHLLNRQAKELGQTSVFENPFISHALKLKLGERKVKIHSIDLPDNIKKDITNLIDS